LPLLHCPQGGDYKLKIKFSLTCLSSAPYFSAANQLYLRRITLGCNLSPLSFCPLTTLNRASAAALIIRSIYSALYGDPENFTVTQAGFGYTPSSLGACTSHFSSDVPVSDPNFFYIQKMWELGRVWLFCVWG
jgi:hypothetical protein